MGGGSRSLGPFDKVGYRDIVDLGVEAGRGGLVEIYRTSVNLNVFFLLKHVFWSQAKNVSGE